METRVNKIAESLVRILNTSLENQRRPRRYGIEEELYPAEIHLLVMISTHPQGGVTDLAATAGVTKGAVSQMASKLVAKGVLVKESDPANATRVVLALTDRGRAAVAAHDRQHEDADRELIAFVQGLESCEAELLQRFLDLVEAGMVGRQVE